MWMICLLMVGDQTAELRDALMRFDMDRVSQIIQAPDASVPAQLLVEARVLHAVVDRSVADHNALIKTLDTLHQQVARGEYDYEVVPDEEVPFYFEVLKALTALHLKNDVAFEQHIKEAFWLQPLAGQMLSSMIGLYKSEKFMSTTQIHLKDTLVDVDGNPVVLADLMQGKRLIAIDFWASWCRPCLDNMPTLKQREKAWSDRGVLLVAVNVDDNPKKALPVRAQYQFSLPWLYDRDKKLSELLNVDSLPNLVLADAAGKLLFTGHPEDPLVEGVLDAHLH